MIVMRLRGRLGNHLFIYAFGRALQEKYHQPLVLLDNVNNTGGTMLSDLNIPNDVQIVSYQAGYKNDYSEKKAADYERKNNFLSSIKNEWLINRLCIDKHLPVLSAGQSCNYITYKLKARGKSSRERFEYETSNVDRLAKLGLLICENGYIDFPETAAKNIFAFGYFQSEKYFADIKDKIRQEIQSSQTVKQSLKGFIADIQKSNSVCLNVRMGDYTNNPIMGVCTLAYYQNAIDQMYNMYHDAKIFVFSNDIEKVKKSFHFQKEVVFEPQVNNPLETLKYMSMCKHFIISNSSFAWWAQYLGEYEKKTVIAPEKWFAKDIPCDIQQSNWIYLPV